MGELEEGALLDGWPETDWGSGVATEQLSIFLPPFSPEARENGDNYGPEESGGKENIFFFKK